MAFAGILKARQRKAVRAMKKDDYGFYGKGLDGYAHYRQAFDQTQRAPDADNAPQHGRTLPPAPPRPARPVPPRPARPARRARRTGVISGGSLLLICAVCLTAIALLSQCA